VLEANYGNARQVLLRTRQALTSFGIFFPKKKYMLDHLGKLVEAFNTPEDRMLLLKRSSMKKRRQSDYSFGYVAWRKR
jgi:hypothetical protein